MQEIKSRAQALADKYNAELIPLGVRVELSKKYMETEVAQRSTYSSDAGVRLLNYADAHADKKREKAYKNQPNRYHCIVLDVLPTDKTQASRKDCKTYAFMLRKTERAHVGMQPESVTYKQDKVLMRIEKRLEKLRKSAQKRGAARTCTNTVFDTIRYSMSAKYAYKRRNL